MSYCYDVMAKAWATLAEKLPHDVRYGETAVRFEFLINEMHEANHRLGDAINKDARVTTQASILDKALNETNP